MSDILYYYCNTSTFLSIIKNAKLRVTNIKKMNDYSEKRWYYEEVFSQLFEHETLREINAESNPRLLSDLFFLYKHWRTFLVGVVTIPEYILCFSEEGDLLSQWRAYSDDGNGVAIGFNKDVLKKLTESDDGRFELKAINYLDPKEINNKVEDLKNSIKKFDHNRKVNYQQNIIDAMIRQDDYLIKNPAFKEEKEWRMIHMPGNNASINFNEKFSVNKFQISELKFATTQNDLKDYKEIDFSHYKDSIIKEVILGPKSRMDLQYDVYNLFYELGYEASEYLQVKKSIATYW